MKYIAFFLLMFALSFGNSSCQKEFVLSPIDSSKITPPTVTGNFTALVDGERFIANEVAVANLEFGMITLTGVSKTGETIGLAVLDSGVRTYTLGLTVAGNAGIYSKKNEISYSTGSGNDPQKANGTINIKSIDKQKQTISGTFSMNVFREGDGKSKTITEGVFTDISYKRPELPPASAKDTFRVKVDGKAFPTHSVVGLQVGSTIAITANNQTSDQTVGLVMPADVKNGTFAFELFGAYLGQYNPSRTVYEQAKSGSLKITEHNPATKRIKGTFTFVAEELTGTKKSTLTEGYFAVTYQ